MKRKKTKILCLSLTLLLLLAIVSSLFFVFADSGEVYVSIDEIKEATASSFASGYEPIKAFDGIEGNPNNCWHTPWGAEQTP